jgi:hypothetical protein
LTLVDAAGNPELPVSALLAIRFEARHGGYSPGIPGRNR